MADKKVMFQEDPEVNEFQPEEVENATGFKKGKHSLDSDEEDDDADKYDVMNEDDIEGQEEPTIDYDDDIQITPFNMKDELEEGHFDKDGNFIFDKTKNIKDHWIDNINWVRIKESERQKAQQMIQAREDAQEMETPPVDRVAIFKEMMELLQPQETVAKALRRLGKSKGKPLTTAQRWKAKRQKTESGAASGGPEAEKVEQDKQTMLRLTEMADSLVQEGMMEIYEATREKVAVMLKQEEGKKFAIPDDVDEDDALDMFADNFDKTEGKKSGGSGDAVADNGKGDPSSSTAEVSGTATENAEDEVRWEYKEEDSDTSPLLGPYTTTQMMAWKDDGKFKTGVLCRRVGTQAQFYSSNRVDFDLYI
ncbi:CD2 antigen cytoplasmic tail-binding protein 2 homolog [Littorina saxatilis]|uniref:GYF domain-containing protein n=1 Tax=Littorina saxatilis TaxID=31220 RepID=A0AAN9AHR8_9CAEN